MVTCNYNLPSNTHRSTEPSRFHWEDTDFFPWGRKRPFLLPEDCFYPACIKLIRRKSEFLKEFYYSFFYLLSVEWRNEGHCFLCLIYTSILLFMESLHKGRVHRVNNTNNLWQTQKRKTPEK